MSLSTFVLGQQKAGRSNFSLFKYFPYCQYVSNQVFL